MAGQQPQIEQFLLTSVSDPDHVSLRSPLLRELIRIDLEHRWRATSGSPSDRAEESTTIQPGQDTRVAPRSLPRKPWVEDYLSFFPELGPVDSVAPDLIAEEYRARHRWGDQPKHEEYVERFPRQGACLGEALAQVDLELAGKSRALVIRVYEEQQLVLLEVVDGPVELGRQRAEEHEPYSIRHQDDGWRVVIARLEEESVSRQHARVELLEPDQIQVTNLSATRSISFQDGVRLGPGEKRVFSEPMLFTLGHRAVRVQGQ
ncbi:MAG: hypothetical protein HY000_04195 [Planctomycetes bacterium]|nr:hypothetical protein [Planctomycetota bacterium]